MKNLLFMSCAMVNVGSSVLADFVSLQNPNGQVVAVINTEQVQYASANGGSLTVQFIGTDANRFVINNQGNGGAELVQMWLTQIRGAHQ